MQFRDIKAGDVLYKYDRTNIVLSVEKIVSASAPRLDKTAINAGMVVDVVVDNMTYTFKDTAEVGYTGNLVISTDKNTILREVEAQKAQNEAHLSRVETLKAELPKLDAVIDQLSPERKEKKVQEERMLKMEDSINSLKEMVELLISQKPNGSK